MRAQAKISPQSRAQHPASWDHSSHSPHSVRAVATGRTAAPWYPISAHRAERLAIHHQSAPTPRDSLAFAHHPPSHAQSPSQSCAGRVTFQLSGYTPYCAFSSDRAMRLRVLKMYPKDMGRCRALRPCRVPTTQCQDNRQWRQSDLEASPPSRGSCGLLEVKVASRRLHAIVSHRITHCFIKESRFKLVRAQAYEFCQ